MDLKRQAGQVLADLGNNNYGDGGSFAAAVLKQRELVQAFADAGNSSLKRVSSSEAPDIYSIKGPSIEIIRYHGEGLCRWPKR